MKLQSIGLLILILAAQAHAENKAKPAETQEKAVAAVKKLGGTVLVDENLPRKPAIYVSIRHTRVSDAGLVHLKGLLKLRHLYLFNTNVTDAGIQKLQQALPNCGITH